ncbi:MAG TPA: zinc dependent phospholipase C family protein [Anaerovoracaceae bacterium]|nr:zinc dependent phospholipase C family protein [Anaerovoracaceae bacterium]
MKKYLALVLIMTLIFSLTSINSFAAQDTELSTSTQESTASSSDGITDGETVIVPQWGSGNHTDSNPGTHGFIAQRGLIILKSAKSQASTFYTSSYSSTIKSYSIKPDVDETTNGFSWHFYGENGLNYLGGTPTAYTKFRDHYNNAVSYYKANNKTAAMQSLGRALHYVGDLNEPHHVLNLIAGLSRHTEYEGWVETHYSQYAISSVSTSTLDFIKNSTLKGIADDSASSARPYIEEVEAFVLSGTTPIVNESIVGPATSTLLSKSQKVTAGVLYKFMYDVGYL